MFPFLCRAEIQARKKWQNDTRTAGQPTNSSIRISDILVWNKVSDKNSNIPLDPT